MTTGYQGRSLGIGGLFTRFVESEAEQPIRDVQASGSERLQRVAYGRHRSEPVARQDQADGADACDPEPGCLATRGMVV